MEQLQKPIIAAVDRLSTQVGVLALVQLADEFYTKDERTNLYQQYQELEHAETVIRSQYNESRPDDGLSRDQRIAKLGEEKANEQLRPSDELFDKLQAAMGETRRFRNEHPLIIDLLRLRTGKTNLANGVTPR